MLEFGVQVTPTADVGLQRELVAAAEEGGLDLVGVQDHPYAPGQLDAFAVIADLLSRTERLRFFPDVACLPLRPPAMLATAATALDLQSGGRFELALGAGGYWRRIVAMGVPGLSPAESLAALEEAISILRALWHPGEVVTFAGKHYRLDAFKTAQAPAHPVGIWVGSIGTRSLRLTGRLADGWAAPIPQYLPYERWTAANRTIDEAAIAAGRDPAGVRRIVQLVGSVTDAPADSNTTTGAEPMRGTPRQWAGLIARLATEQPFRTVVLWPERQTPDQVEMFAREVVPAARALLADRPG